MESIAQLISDFEGLTLGAVAVFMGLMLLYRFFVSRNT